MVSKSAYRLIINSIIMAEFTTQQNLSSKATAFSIESLMASDESGTVINKEMKSIHLLTSFTGKLLEHKAKLYTTARKMR